MPVFRSGIGKTPSWCEMTYFDIVEVGVGEAYTFERMGLNEKVVAAAGRCHISCGHAAVQGFGAKLELWGTADEGDPRKWTDDARFVVDRVTQPTTLVRVAGHWEKDSGIFGVFRVGEGDGRKGGGDAVDYVKTTQFDAHWHDCDEYWIFFEGQCEVVSEGKHYEVGAGDCLATGIGHHHDIANVHGEYVLGVYHETTMRRQKRRGHLWTYEHGEARPEAGRV